MSKPSYGLQPLDQKISQLLKPIFSGNKKEFVIISNLIKNWEDIIGKKYTKFCYPKSVNFNKDKSGAKLTIGVYNASVGFFLENSSEFLIEKIATLYGHKTISKIIIKQEPRDINDEVKEKIILPEAQQKKLTNSLKNIENQDLSFILEELGKEIFSKKNN